MARGRAEARESPGPAAAPAPLPPARIPPSRAEVADGKGASHSPKRPPERNSPNPGTRLVREETRHPRFADWGTKAREGKGLVRGDTAGTTKSQNLQ